MELKEWLNSDITKVMLVKLYDLRSEKMEAILSSSNKELSSGMVIGITDAINFIENLEEGDL